MQNAECRNAQSGASSTSAFRILHSEVTMHRFLVVVAVWAAGFATGLAQGSMTVLDGVYTHAQAERGETLYSTSCIGCHEGQDADGPELTGKAFLDRWREDKLESLFTFIKTTMPGNAPGSLDERAYA